MEFSTAMYLTDWLDSRSLEDWHLEYNCFVGGSHRWMDNVVKDIQAMKIINWKRCAQGRNKWKSVVEQVKTHIEL
jgi:hypothetical protein